MGRADGHADHRRVLAMSFAAILNDFADKLESDTGDQWPNSDYAQGRLAGYAHVAALLRQIVVDHEERPTSPDLSVEGHAGCALCGGGPGKHYRVRRPGVPPTSDGSEARDGDMVDCPNAGKLSVEGVPGREPGSGT
jgi:hypothetical protein